MNCLHCHKPIVLVPSAAERAKKDVTGKTAEYYTKLFDYHAACTLELRQVKRAEPRARVLQRLENGMNDLEIPKALALAVIQGAKT